MENGSEPKDSKAICPVARKTLPIGAKAGQNLTEPKEKPSKEGVFPLEFFHWSYMMALSDFGEPVTAGAASSIDGPSEDKLRAADLAQMEAGARSDAAATAKIQHPNYLGNALNNKVVDAATVRELCDQERSHPTGLSARSSVSPLQELSASSWETRRSQRRRVAYLVRCLHQAR